MFHSLSQCDFVLCTFMFKLMEIYILIPILGYLKLLVSNANLAIQRLFSTDPLNCLNRYIDSERRFQHVLEACGVNKSLIKLGVKEGDTVIVGDVSIGLSLWLLHCFFFFFLLSKFLLQLDHMKIFTLTYRLLFYVIMNNCCILLKL